MFAWIQSWGFWNWMLACFVFWAFSATVAAAFRAIKEAQVEMVKAQVSKGFCPKCGTELRVKK